MKKVSSAVCSILTKIEKLDFFEQAADTAQLFQLMNDDEEDEDDDF